MKKIIIILLMFAMLIPIAFGNKFAEEGYVELIDSKDWTTGNYKVVNIMIDGDDILADIPAVIYEYKGEYRTLVPISFITDKIGGDISWNQEKKQVTIDYNGKNIILTIDSNEAIVNGEKYILPSDVPAKLLSYNGSYRTMVPVRFITEQLGYEIFWIDDTKTVSINKPEQNLTNIRYNSDGMYPELRFNVTGEVSATSFSVDGSLVGGDDQLVIDFHNTKLELKNPPKYGTFIINDMIEEIYDIEFVQSDTKPYNTKAIIGLGYYRNGDISYDEVNNEIVVQLINSVNYVDVEEIRGYKTVVIDTTENPAYNPYVEDGKYYIDIVNSKLKYSSEGASVIDVNEGGLSSVKYSEVTESTNTSYYDAGTKLTRVEIDLDGVSPDTLYTEGIGSKVYVYISGKPLGGYSYSRDLQNGSSILGIDLYSDNQYPINYNEVENSIMVTVPKSDVINTDLIANTKIHDDGVIDTVLIKSDSTGNNFIVKVYLNDETTYSEITSVKSLSLQFVNKKLKDSKYKDKIIVVDAGHGGHDPGAVSPNGIKEKDIALEAALLLKKKLENQGFKVLLTRERDNYVKLYDRASIANQINADIFVSVHINAASNTNAKGIETLYAADSSRDNYNLAKDIQEGMLNYTGAVDRGTVNRPELVVIRETEMEAVLVELGFLSNESDEINLLKESYLNKCIDGIVEGIIEFIQ